MSLRHLLLRRCQFTSKFSSSSSVASRVKLSVLPNGMRVASETLPGCPTATVGVWIDAGSRWESAKNNGAAHFLEHMAFKGTARRSQTAIELEVEDAGGHLNAYTSREQTAYYAKSLANDVPRTVDLLADILQHSRLDQAAIERERDVILREAEEVAKQTEEVVFDHLHAVAYQGTSLGRTILGPEENIRSLTRGDLAAYIQQHYTANRMVLAAAGGIEHEQLVQLAEKSFAHLPRGSSVNWTPEPARYTGSEVRMLDEEMPAAHMAIAVEGASWTSPDYLPLLLAQAIVGSWNRGLAAGAANASRLAQVVAEHGLATSFMSFNTSYHDTGLFGIYLVSDRTQGLDDLIYEVQQEWVRLCLSASEAEVARAKTQLKASLLLALDGTTALAEDIGRQILVYGRHHPWSEVHAMIDAIDAATVRRVATEYLYDRCPAVVGLGPIGTMPDYNRIRAATLWLRN